MHGEPPPLSPLQHEGAPAGTGKRAAVGAGDLGEPTSGDPRALAGGADASIRLEAEVADARSDVFLLLADDVVETCYRAGLGAEGYRVVGKQRAVGGEIAGAHHRLERVELLLGCRG